MDNIGKNEKLLKASKDFQKLDDGKKKRRLLREAQIKDGTLSLTPEQIQKIKDSREIKEKVIQEKFEHRYPTKLSRERRFQYLEKYIPRKEGTSDEEYIKELIKFPDILFQDEKKGEHITVSALKKDPKNKKNIEVKIGKRGGRYTEDTTDEGRPYRRYF